MFSKNPFRDFEKNVRKILNKMENIKINLKNKEERRRYNKEHYKKNIEKRKEQMKKWGKANQGYSKIYYKEHKQELYEYGKEYRKNHKKEKAEYDKRYAKENPQIIRAQRISFKNIRIPKGTLCMFVIKD